MIKKTLTLLIFFAFSFTMLPMDNTVKSQLIGETGQAFTQKASAAVSAANLFLPDSIIVKDTLGNKTGKYVYEYDQDGNVTTNISFTVNSTKTGWYPKSKLLRTYAANKMIIHNELYEWNMNSNSWKGFSMTDYQFDDQGRYILKTYYSWDSTNKSWYTSAKNVYHYPGPGTMSTDSAFSLDSSTKQFYSYSVNECTYSTDKQQATVIQTKFDKVNNVWTPQAKTLYSLDQYANDTLAVVSSWDKTSDTFVLNTRIHTSYVNKNKRREYKEGWDNTNQQWVYSSDFTYTFNSAGNQTFFERYYWNSSKGSRYGDSKSTSEYDSTGNNLISSHSYSWDGTTNNWALLEKNKFFYTTPGKIDSLQYFTSYYNRIILFQILHYYYKTNQTGISTPTQNNYVLYPNPTQNEFKIQGVDAKCCVTIYDMLGKVRLSKWVATNQPVNIQNLESGTYIVKGYDDHTSFSTKLVVK